MLAWVGVEVMRDAWFGWDVECGIDDGRSAR